MTPEPVIPISAIEHYVYCPRQCALIHCDGVWSDYAHTVRGTRAHRRVDSGQHRTERGRRGMRYLNTLYVRDHRARVQHRRGSLTVSSPEGSQRVPLEALDAVVVLGGAQVTMQALDACVHRGVRVSAHKRSGAVRFLVNGPTSGNVHLRTALFAATMIPHRLLGRPVGRWAIPSVQATLLARHLRGDLAAYPPFVLP